MGTLYFGTIPLPNLGEPAKVPLVVGFDYGFIRPADGGKEKNGKSGNRIQ